MKGINTCDLNHPDRVVDALGRIHIPDTRLKAVRTRKDCRRCSLDNDFESCIKAKCRRAIYKQLPKEIIRI